MSSRAAHATVDPGVDAAPRPADAGIHRWAAVVAFLVIGDAVVLGGVLTIASAGSSSGGLPLRAASWLGAAITVGVIGAGVLHLEVTRCMRGCTPDEMARLPQAAPVIVKAAHAKGLP